MKTVLERVPLAWAGYTYYTDFMKALDPCLLQAPIFKSTINLTSSRNVRSHQLRFRIQLAKNYLKAHFPTAYRYYLSRHKPLKKQETDEEELLKIFQLNYNKDPYACDLFNSKLVEKHLFKLGRPFPERVITVLLFLNELKKRHSNSG